MLVSKEYILDLIPQRPPFLMIDALISSSEDSTETVFEVREENIFATDGFLGEAALIENIAQTAAARAGYYTKERNLPVLVGYIGAIKDLQILRLPKISDTLETQILIKTQVFEVTVVTGTVRCRSEILAQCEMKIFIIKP